MLGKREVDAELRRSLGLSMKTLQPLFAAGGDARRKKVYGMLLVPVEGQRG